MEKNRKKIRIAFWCTFIVLGLALGASRSAFSLSDEVFYFLFGLLVFAVVFGIFFINQLWYKEFMSTVNALSPILTVENDPDRYIAENEKLLETKSSNITAAILLMNISVACCDKGDYEQAKRRLSEVAKEKIHGINRVIYLINYAYVCFYLGDNDEALNAMKQNTRGLKDFKTNPNIGGIIAVLNIFELLSKGENDKANQLYAQSKPQWQSKRSKDDFEYLKQKLQELGFDAQ